MKILFYKIIFLMTFISAALNVCAQQDTAKYMTYDESKKKPPVSPKDTVVKVARPIEKPGTLLGNILQYLSPVKKQMVDSIYPIYGKDSPFFMHESNHVTESEVNRLDSNAYHEDYWNRVYHLKIKGNKLKRDTVNKLNRVVYGYHPYWMGTAYKDYNFNLLSRIAYFSLPVEPKTGNLTQIRYWNETGIVKLAHAYGCKVDLCISNFGQQNNTLLLTNPMATKKLVANIIKLITKRNKKGRLLKRADGVNINFEELPKARKNDFTTFIKYLRGELNKINPDFKIIITIPAIDWRNAFDIANLKNEVDYFFVMGYNFYGKYSTTAGPTSLLFSGGDWIKNNIDNTIKNYIKLGAEPKKLLLGLAYYGNEWVTKDGNVPSEKIYFVKARTYSYINSHYADKYVAHYDSTSHSIYYIFREGNLWKQCWTDNELTLSIKYDYIRESGLGGLGIWALGYDNNYPELWQLIEDKFTSPPDTSTDIHTLIANTLEYNVSKKSLELVDKTSPDYTKRFQNKINNFWHFAALFFAVIMTFAVIGFVRAVSDFDIRFVLFSKEVRVYLFFILIAAITLALLRLWQLLDNTSLVVIISIIIGISAALLVLKVGGMKREKNGEETP